MISLGLGLTKLRLVYNPLTTRLHLFELQLSCNWVSTRL